MALPGDSTRTVRPPQRWRIGIGETVPTQDGKSTRPQKLDYFTIRKLTYQRGQAPQYVVDPEMQALMEQAAGCGRGDKPRAVPVQVIGGAVAGNLLPESILYSELAWYGGGRALCSCGAWDAEGLGTATRPVYRPRGENKGYYREGEQTLVCDPKACPYRLGTHDLPKAKGVPVCKPHVILSVVLPWCPAVGGTAKLKTTGWKSYYGMRDSLLQIASHTRGWLHGLDLWLVYEWATSGGNMVPLLQFEFRGSQHQLRAAAVDAKALWVGQETQLKQLEAGVVEETKLLLADAAEQQATNREFFPETQDDAPTNETHEPLPYEEGEFEEPGKPMFDSIPETIGEFIEAFASLGEEARCTKLMRAATRQVLGRPLDQAPESTTGYENPDQEAELLRALVSLAEEWWDRHGGRNAHPEAVKCGEPSE